MKNYTIKPLKWQKIDDNWFAEIDLIDFNDEIGISKEGDKYSLTFPGTDTEYSEKTLEKAKEKAQSLWEKQLKQFLKEVK